jgi:hypothetical protein
MSESVNKFNADARESYNKAAGLLQLSRFLKKRFPQVDVEFEDEDHISICNVSDIKRFALELPHYTAAKFLEKYVDGENGPEWYHYDLGYHMISVIE